MKNTPRAAAQRTAAPRQAQLQTSPSRGGQAQAPRSRTAQPMAPRSRAAQPQSPRSRTAQPQAPKARGAKGHFFTAPAAPTGPRPQRGGASQRARPARTPSWDDETEAATAMPSNPMTRGTKVRSRRPTGAQELRAQMLREDARAKQAQRAPQQTARAQRTPAPPGAGFERAQPHGTSPRGAVRRATSGATGGAIRGARSGVPSEAIRGARSGDARTGTHRAAPAARPVKLRATAPPSSPTLAPAIEFLLHGEHIALDNLLKLTGLAPSGGAAKALTAEGLVKVDGQVELRKTCKIRAGQLVQTAGARIRVAAAA